MQNNHKILEIYILGVGHNTSVFIELVKQCGFKIAGLFHYNDSRNNEIDHGCKILGSFNDLFNKPSLSGLNFALSQGDNKIRADLFEKIKQKGGSIPTLIHPTAHVSEFAILGEGVVININSVIHPDVIIGDNTIVSYNVSITHNTIIGKHCYFAFGAMIGAYTTINDFVFMGIGAIIISGKVNNVGNSSYIGAAALITKDVPSKTIVAGSPARIIKHIE